MNWRSTALAAVLVVASVAALAQPVPPARIQVQSGGAFKGWAKTLNLDATDHAITCTSDMSCAVVNGANTTELGSVIGDVCTDFPTIAAGGVDMSCTALELPNGTATVSADCDAAGETGRVFVDSDAALYAKGYLCEGASGWMPMGNVYTEGRSGGQIIRGGTAAADTVDIRASAASNYTGTVHLARGTLTAVPAGTWNGVTLLNDGATWDPTTALSTFNLIRSSGTVTISATPGVLAYTRFIFDNRIIKTSGTVATQPLATGISEGFVVRNDTATNVTVPLVQPFAAEASLSKTGSGTLTVTRWSNFTSSSGSVPAGVTVTDYVVGQDVPGVTNSGTLTRLWGNYVAALSGGTSNFQYGAAEHTVSDLVPAGTVVFGGASGSPGRFYTKNENQQRWDMGYTSWTGSTGAALAADSTTYYFPVNDRARGTTGTLGVTTTEGDHDVPAPGALTVFAMACAVNVAPANGGGTQTRTFTLREAAGSVAPSCVISEAATSCTWCVASSGTPCSTTAASGEAVAVGALIDIMTVPASTPAASDATCTIWYTLDAF